MLLLRPIVIERLTRYHRYLAEGRGPLTRGAVTSGEIATALDVDPTQVRKDLGAIGLRGRGRVGFDPDEVVGALRAALGFDRTHRAIVVGVGRLGGALLTYRGFARYGLKILAAFDTDPERVGREVAGCPVLHSRRMRRFVRRHGIGLAIVATPEDVAQRVVDRLVSAGVTAIWNFAPLKLRVPEGVDVRDEHISVGLSHLTSRSRDAQRGADGRATDELARATCGRPEPGT
jgi:redox-sensing transcriptional repressor